MSEAGDANRAGFEVGSLVRLREKVAGVRAGTIGRVLGWYANTGEHSVLLQSGMPVRVDPDLLEQADRP